MNVIQSLFSLNGKVAVVTGGARGIGKECASVLSQAGVSVAILDRDGDAARDAAAEIAANGGTATAMTLDVADAKRVKATFASVVEKFGRLDVLVNNAGLVKRVPALETTIEAWREVMAVNLDAAFTCSCEAAAPMTAGGGGAIINIASIMGLSGGGLYPIASYHASKGGLINLTRGLAVEWAERNIRVNAIAPTWVRTELTRGLLDDPERSRAIFEVTPLRRFAEPIDVAAAVLYLASPAAKMITGHTLAVDGGYLAR